jgi:hypothetical protein
MKIERIFLSGLLVALCVFVNGTSIAEESQTMTGTQQILGVQKSMDDSQKSIKTNPKKAAKKRKSQTKKTNQIDKSAPANQHVLQKPLDLSVPYPDIQKNGLLIESNSEPPPKTTNIFASENKKKTRPVQLDGRLLMSPEPEAEKQKSADGAGIVINLKP